MKCPKCGCNEFWPVFDWRGWKDPPDVMKCYVCGHEEKVKP